MKSKRDIIFNDNNGNEIKISIDKIDIGGWVVIDKELDEYKRFKSVKLCGSIKAIEELGIIMKKRSKHLGTSEYYASCRQLAARLSKDEAWSNARYFIKWCPLIRIKRKNLN